MPPETTGFLVPQLTGILLWAPHQSFAAAHSVNPQCPLVTKCVMFVPVLVMVEVGKSKSGIRCQPENNAALLPFPFYPPKSQRLSVLVREALRHLVKKKKK